MKRGYKRLLIFSIVLIIILLMNSFITNFLSSYSMIFFLVALIIFFDKFFILEKDKHRYLKEILFEILLFVISFFLLYYLLGLIVGLAKTPNYFTFEGIRTFILPTIIYCILREILRYNMLSKADQNTFSTIIVIIVFIFLDLTNSIYYATFNSKYEILKFISIELLPIIATNISYSYVSKKMGFKPVIVFDLIFSLYPYLIPIIPNPSEYLASIIYILTPVLFARKIFRFFDNKEDYDIPSDYYKKKFKGAIIPSIIIIFLIYFYSGYFRFYAIAIASGSMTPKIKKGDVVVVDRKYKYDELEKGQIIAYKEKGIIIVHRIAKKVKLGDSYIYYTKGDANDNIDEIIIDKDKIIGVTNFNIPYIGYPTVWFSER